MEEFSFSYKFTDESGETKTVECRKVGEGVRTHELCELFMDFMESVGYCEDSIFNYFSD